MRLCAIQLGFHGGNIYCLHLTCTFTSNPRISSEPIFCICITIDAMLNFDGDFWYCANAAITCEQGFTVGHSFEFSLPFFQEAMNRTSLESTTSFCSPPLFRFIKQGLRPRNHTIFLRGRWVSRHFYLRFKYQRFIHNSKKSVFFTVESVTLSFDISF